MDKIVILGCGYIGSNLANYIVGNYDAEVIVCGYYDFYAERLNENVQFVTKGIEELSVDDVAMLRGAIVVDATGNTNATSGIDDSNIRFLENCAHKISLIQKLDSMDIKRYVFLSSGGTVYLDGPLKHTETEQTYPNNIYALEKITIENFLRLYSREKSTFPYQILRLGNPYGGIVSPRKSQGIIDVAIIKLREGQELELFGDLDNVRDYIYMEDMCRYITEMIRADHDGEIFNIGSGVGYSLRDVIAILENVTGRQINFSCRESDTENIRCNILNTDKINEYCSFPLTSLEEGIRKCYNG